MKAFTLFVTLALTLIAFAVLLEPATNRVDAPPVDPSPQLSQIGKSTFFTPAVSLFSFHYSKHYADFEIVSEDKLIVPDLETNDHCHTMGICLHLATVGRMTTEARTSRILFASHNPQIVV